LDSTSWQAPLSIRYQPVVSHPSPEKVLVAAKSAAALAMQNRLEGEMDVTALQNIYAPT
jgi:hypothetical protein